MISAPIPSNETERLAALQRYGVLDTAAEPAFDRLARILQYVMDVPTVLVSLTDAQRQWFKSRLGLDIEQWPRDISLCGHAVFQGAPLIVPDATRDPRFADNPLVSGPLGLRFYAGVPLLTADGWALGTLCAIDYSPRLQPSDEVMAIMTQLAATVVDALELRRYAPTAAQTAQLDPTGSRP